ncbi:Appr-1-p processing protein [Niallia circulans]|uniref:Appr-1-p processing protein n=1 Tax=Niallia circulans TaxID=1397 RepID=A0AA91Z2C9_NIACI|nr:macro domain-containing protein [Niallia circulans]PAD84952.1 Appr-1-p processing protein [Niallia circulans]
MIKIVKGNILDAREDLICHQVNCKGVMGAGLAKQIRNKYPVVFEKYKNLCNSHVDKLLGSTQYVDVSDGKVVVNMFAQDGYGRGKRQTDYDALRLCLESIHYTVTSNNTVLNGKSVALPYQIGCGLAGGDWDIVYKMIKEILGDIELTIYKLV